MPSSFLGAPFEVAHISEFSTQRQNAHTKCIGNALARGDDKPWRDDVLDEENRCEKQANDTDDDVGESEEVVFAADLHNHEKKISRICHMNAKRGGAYPRRRAQDDRLLSVEISNL